MKKKFVIIISSLLILSLGGCSSKPSEEKIKSALDEGTITVEDAKEKGWIDDDWIKANYETVKQNQKFTCLIPLKLHIWMEHPLLPISLKEKHAWSFLIPRVRKRWRNCRFSMISLMK